MLPSLDTQTNPNDHCDHMITAKAALEASAALEGARRVHYIVYASSALPANLNPLQET
jgi:hypothetical protein